MSNSRVQLTKDVWMHLNGQGQIVLCGSVIDIVQGSISPQHCILLAETPATVSVPTSVRSVRTK